MKNNFGKHSVELDNKLLIQVWKNEGKEMEEEDFKKIMLEYADLIVKHKLERILVDARSMNYIVVPELQNWINQEIASRALPYNDKIAFVMPSDFFEQVSIQQSMEDVENSGNHITEYFENLEKAREWLLA